MACYLAQGLAMGQVHRFSKNTKHAKTVQINCLTASTVAERFKTKVPVFKGKFQILNLKLKGFIKTKREKQEKAHVLTPIWEIIPHKKFKRNEVYYEE